MTVLFCIGVSLGVTMLQTPVYRSGIVLEIQGLNESFMNMRDLTPNGAVLYSDDIYLETQTKLLQTASLAGRVADSVHLANRLQNAAVRPRSLFASWLVSGDTAAPAASRESAIQKLQNSVHVSSVGQSRLVRLTVDSPNPQLSADIANAYATEYIGQSREMRWDSAIQTSTWLSNQLDLFRRKLQTAENELQAYARSADLLYTGDKDSVSEEKLRQLQTELIRAQSDRVEKQAQLELIASSPAESLPRVGDDGAIREYKSKLLDLRSQLAEMSASYTPEHFKVKRLEDQIAEVQGILNRERTALIRRIQNDFDAAKRREDMMVAAYKSQAHRVSGDAAKAVRYNILKSQVQADRELYQGMQQKVQGSTIASALQASNVRVVDPARPNPSPYRPSTMLNAATGLGAGLMLSLLLVVVRERNDRLIRGPGETLTSLNIPELGSIPSARYGRLPGSKDHLSGGLGSRSRKLTGTIIDGSAELTAGDLNSLELVTWHQKHSLMAESFRAVTTSLLSMEPNGGRPRVVLITSANTREGKTLTAMNLAISLARSNRKTLLIDCDLRRPRLHGFFNLNNDFGLMNLLEDSRSIGDYPVEDITRTTFVPDLRVLPTGTGDQDTFRMLTSLRLAELIRRFRREFECVVMDSPPVGVIADARLLARVSDGVIMVCRAGQTSHDWMRLACKRITEDGSPVLGTILNDFEPDAREWRVYKSYSAAAG